MAETLWEIEKALFTKLPPTNEHINPHLQPEKPKASQKKPSKWDPPDAAFKVDLSTAISYEDIGNINWANQEHFKGVERSEKGTEGLFFVSAESGVFIVKRSSNIASEVFCSLLGMRLGLHAPKVRVVSSNSEEGNNMLTCLAAIDKSFRVITTLANLSNILLMELVRGITLNKLDSKTAPEVLQKSTLQQLGSLMALDAIVNNSDRLPLVWTNEGNLDNIMLSERGATVVPIDSKIIPLEASHPHGERVKELLQIVLAHPNHESSQFHRIRDLITLYTEYDVGTEGSISMQEGFIATVRECASFDLSAFEKELTSWQEALQKHHNLSISPQAIPFIIRMLQIFHDAIHNPSPPSTSTSRIAPSTASSSKPPVSTTTSTSAPSSSSSSSTPSQSSSESLANLDECAWIKVVVPNEKPAPRRYHSGVLYEGKLYVFGGVCVKTASNDFYVFDFDTKKWAIVVAQGEGPSARCGHSATVHGGKMWIFGGHDNNRHAYNDLYAFDFATSTWEKIAQAEGDVWPSPRYHHSATLVGSSLFVFGGAADKSKYFNDIYVFNFETQKWELRTVTGEIPAPRAGQITVEWNNILFTFGGYGGDGGYNYFVESHSFEIATNTFHEIDCSGTFPRTARPLSYVPYYFGQGANAEGAVFTFGGSDGKGPLGNLYLWNLRTHKWKIVKAWMGMDESNATGFAAIAAGKLDPIPRYGHCTVMDDSGIISLFGGSGSLFLDDIVQFDLGEN